MVDKIWKCLFIKSEYLLSWFYCYWFVTRICWLASREPGCMQAKISARLMFTYNMDSFYSLSYKTSISMPLVCWYVSRILDQLLLFSNNTDYQAGFCFYYIVILMFNSYLYFVIQAGSQENQSQLVLSSNHWHGYPISQSVSSLWPHCPHLHPPTAASITSHNQKCLRQW